MNFELGQWVTDQRTGYLARIVAGMQPSARYITVQYHEPTLKAVAIVQTRDLIPFKKGN